jgi:hypothetical protein
LSRNAAGQQRADLTRKPDAAVYPREIEGLHAEAIADQQDTPTRAIERGEGE